ncbi:alanine racemase [Erythrobacter rubeus]|uniref:alanine racemase n=1 Tax=Erythrobacter rubeus TaxID=2760803 RepID=A0ABR8KML7_9SPHN|nr:alanine racemase [Erythrobacter rubeus]MBD2841791.1 alanine racemase [Erythrobacter rubeus]
MTSQADAPEPTHRLRIDTEALAHNWRALDAMSGRAQAGAAVKADCYGLGVDICVPVLRDAGCKHFFVAHWSEVEAVLKHVAADQIAVLHGPLTSAEVDYAIATGVRPVINSVPQAERWIAGGGGVCHLMIDTGINRLGVSTGELDSEALQALDIDLLMSHLASADENGDMNARQLHAFRGAIGKIAHRRLSLSNSAGIALGEDFAVDVTRPGLALYGGVPRPELADAIHQVAFIEAAIIQVREIGAGDSVGYNGEFTATGPMRVGTISLGYADGFLRARGKGFALRHGDRHLPLLGKVSMDMIVVDLAAAPDLGEGDWLDVPFDLKNAAQQSAVSQYELLTVLGQRLRG